MQLADANRNDAALLCRTERILRRSREESKNGCNR